MSDCNIRNIDEALILQMKLAATRDAMTLREWCIEAFTAHLAENAPGKGETFRTHREMHLDQAKAAIYDVVTNQFAPVKHAPNCKCFICKPPKDKYV